MREHMCDVAGQSYVWVGSCEPISILQLQCSAKHEKKKVNVLVGFLGRLVGCKTCVWGGGECQILERKRGPRMPGRIMVALLLCECVECGEHIKPGVGQITWGCILMEGRVKMEVRES